MIMELCLLAGLMGVASNPSPYFAALGLVWGAGVGCVILMDGGFGFLSLVLFLIYLGGMMVVFAYCAALVAEPYPEAWGSGIVIIYMTSYCIMYVMYLSLWGGSKNKIVESKTWGSLINEWWGVSELLSSGGWTMLSGGWGLLLTLFVVLEIVRGHKAGALRAV